MTTTDAFRPLTEQEMKVEAYLRKALADVDHIGYEGPFIAYASMAVDIVRLLVSDAAFKALLKT